MVNRARRPRSPGPVELRAAHVLLFAAVAVPGLALTATGIILLALHRFTYDLVLGILTVAFALFVFVGGFAAWLLVRRGERKTRLHHDFISNVSHELRTPLTGIRVLVETLKRGRTDAEQSERCLDLIDTETRRLTALVEEVLDFGRLQSGTRAVELVPEPIGQLLEQARLDFDALRLGVPAELTVESEAGLVGLVDRRAIGEVLVNLLSNALKYGGESKRIWMRAGRARLRAVPAIAIAVEDDGPGVPLALRRRIFQEFYRGEDDLTQSKPGTGLGLAIAKRLVRAHKGTIHVEPRPGGGSRFVVTVPSVNAPWPLALPAPGSASP